LRPRIIRKKVCKILVTCDQEQDTYYQVSSRDVTISKSSAGGNRKILELETPNGIISLTFKSNGSQKPIEKTKVR